MPVSNITHRIRIGLHHGSLKSKGCINLFTILMVNLLLNYGPKSLSLLILISLFSTNTSQISSNPKTLITPHRDYTCSTDKVHAQWSSTYTSLLVRPIANAMTTIVLLIIMHLLLLSGDIEQNPSPYENCAALNQDLHESSQNSLDQFLEKLITLVHLNVQSVSNKIDIIQAEFGGLDIITLNETWLDHNTDSEDLIIQCFQEPMRRDRGDNRYGGVMLYVNSNIVCKRRADLEVTQVEYICI